MLKALLTVGMLLHPSLALSPWPQAVPSRLPGSSDGNWSWSNPLPRGNALAGITCQGATCLAVGAGGTVLRTTNHGGSWQTRQTGTTKDLATATCTRSRFCVAGGAFGTILTSHNAGTTWTRYQLPRVDHVWSLSCPGAHSCYALAQDVRWDCMSNSCDVPGKDNALFVTQDGGRRWTRVNSGRVTNLSGLVCPSRLQCITYSGFSAVVQRTQDGGKRWQIVGGVPARTDPIAASCPTTRRCYLLAAERSLREVDPVLLRSSDAGASWRSMGFPSSLAHLSDWHDLTCPTVKTCYATGSDSVLITQDGGAAWKVRPVHCKTPLYRAACESGAVCHVLAASSAIETTSDGGRTWRDDVRGPQADLVRLSCPGSAACYALSRDGSFLRSSPATGRWYEETTRLPPETDAASRPGLSCPRSEVCFATGRDATIVRSDDGGISWQSQPNPFTGTAINFQNVACPSTNTCYAVGFGCLRAGCNGQDVAVILRTADGGAKWSTVFNATPQQFQLAPGTLLFEAIACPTVAHCVMTGSPGRIFLTEDSGKTWKSIQSPVNGTNADLVGVTCPNDHTCYTVGWGCPRLGCRIDLFTSTILRSDDGGGSWHQETSNSTTQVEGFLCGPRGICTSGTPLTSISCVSSTYCWAAGGGLSSGDATVLATSNGGHTWNREDTPRGNALLAIDCRASSHCFAAGIGGAVLRRSTDTSP